MYGFHGQLLKIDLTTATYTSLEIDSVALASLPRRHRPWL